MGDIDRRNEKARERAQKTGRVTFQFEVIDVWPACVECSRPIRHSDWLNPGYRACGCPGARWWCGLEGWERVEEKTDG